MNYYYGNIPPRVPYTPVGCVGKWTLIEMNNGAVFPMLISIADPAGMTVGQIPPSMSTTSFPSSSIKNSVCL
ncbi:hypothetical protein [Paenibacillus sp. FSL H8-0332]|uniref:hypothetical protein n=1 Tax=Paenibacillus sp. FSL H8-0332 TaxID=2954742 RepID=UPI0030D3B8B1